MRIALVTQQFSPSSDSGVERSMLNLAAQLRRLGHDCVVITAEEHSSADEREYCVSGTRVRPIRVASENLERPWLQDPVTGSRFGQVLDEEDVEIVHVKHPACLPHVFDPAARRRLPVVGDVVDSHYRSDRARELLAVADAVVSPYRATIDLYASHGFETGTWRHIPWGVDYALHPARLPAPDHDGLVVGFVGNPHVLVEAIRLLADRPIELVLYGDHDDLARVLAPFDLVAIPSDSDENLPLALSAVAAGVPLVASDVPSLRELIQDYECGFLFPVGSAESLAELLGRICDEKAKLSELRRRMRFPPGIEEEAWRLERVYEQVSGSDSTGSLSDAMTTGART
jgi:glycosyltransferase involved in cell wall biosynthesis